MVMKTLTEAREHFEAAVDYIPARYEEGVKKADWLTPAKSDKAEENYATQVRKAIAEKKRQKAIAKMSNDDWLKPTIDKGVPIIGDRIRAALDKWQAEWGPMYESVQRTVEALPPKEIDFRVNINKRLVPVVEQWKKAAGKL